MKIIAHGKESISAAVATAEAALNAGIKHVTIERSSESMVSVLVASTLAYCPVIECAECDATLCPFERQSVDKKAETQAAYELAIHNLKVAEENMRMVNGHG